MIRLKDFFEHDMFDILASFHAVRFVIRSGINFLYNGTYEEVMTWMKLTGHDHYEVTSAKLDFIYDVIEIQIR